MRFNFNFSIQIDSIISGTTSNFLFDLEKEVLSLSPEIWSQCFPLDIQEIPSRSLLNLRFCVRKLQHHLLKIFEGLDFKARVGSATLTNPAFANFLHDTHNSSASCLFSQIPNIYGMLLNDFEWTTSMRLRCFLWPSSLPNSIVCKCGQSASLTHIFNCRFSITYRSTVHNAVRDQLMILCKSHRIESYSETLLAKLKTTSTDVNDFVEESLGSRRSDVLIPWSDGKCKVVDVITADVCRVSADRYAVANASNLTRSEQLKINKYKIALKELSKSSHMEYELCPFAVSLYGRLGCEALKLVCGLEQVIADRNQKKLNLRFWMNRIVFSIFKALPQLINSALMALGSSFDDFLVNGTSEEI
ncbi:hypothetical protein RCL1_007305 [Eukaryota sp. TZLM3-RCL]